MSARAWLPRAVLANLRRHAFAAVMGGAVLSGGVLCGAVLLAGAREANAAPPAGAPATSPFATPADAGYVREPKTAVQFPARTRFNQRGYEIVHTTTIGTRVLGIGTYAAAVGFYLEDGHFDRRRERNAQLTDPDTAKLMVIAFVRTVTAATLQETFEEGLAKRWPDLGKPPNRTDTDRLLNGFFSVNRGEFVQIVWLPGGEIEMLVGRKTTARVRNAALAREVFALFLE